MTRRRKKGFARSLLLNVVVPTAALLLLYDRHGHRTRMRDELVRYRMAWEAHAESLRSEAQFKRYYRMSYESFESLLEIVSPHLQVDMYQALRRTSGRAPLSKAGQLQACLRWLAGGSALDLRIIPGVSKSNFYRIIHRVMNAINVAASLSIEFPTTASQQQLAAASFAAHSTEGVIQGCIGAIDGWLCPIRVPSAKECARVDSFFSGHYHKYGINVQACADSESRFTAYSVSCPGGMNDSLAFRKWALSDLIERLEPGYFVAADNAYTQTVRVMTPYNKAEVKDDAERDNYNFYLSQLRIRVEMAFGLLVNKWRILKSPLNVKLSACSDVIGTCMRLHNFCINERLADGPVETALLLRELRGANQDRDISYSETVEHPSDEPSYDVVGCEDAHAESIVFGEIARKNLVEHVASMNLHRPRRNIGRRTAEQLEDSEASH